MSHGCGLVNTVMKCCFVRTGNSQTLWIKYNFRKQAVCYAVNYPGSIEELQEGTYLDSRSQWPRRSAAARLLRSWVRIPTGAWTFVCCECCVLSGRGLCDELITRPEESYRLWCVVVCDLENLKNKEAMTRVGSQRHTKKETPRQALSSTNSQTHQRHPHATSPFNSWRHLLLRRLGRPTQEPLSIHY